MYRFAIATFILLFGSLVMSQSAAAALSCTASVTVIAFGSITVRDGIADRTTGTVTFNCSGGTPNGSVNACLNLGAGSGGAASGNSPRYMRRSDNLPLDYTLRRTGYAGTTWNNESFTLTLDKNGAANVPATIYGEVTSTGTSINGGSYSSSFSGSNAAFSYGPSSCANAGTSASFTVSATVTPSCTLSITPLAFGLVQNLTTAVDQNATINVTCSNATSYSIKLGLGNGAGVTDPASRKMTLNSNTLTYGLYQNNARTTPWGDQASNVANSTGTGSSQVFTVYGRIASQATPATGSYTDTVVVTVEY